MTVQEIFSSLCDKYGEDFNWYLIPPSQAQGAFVRELQKEIGENHFLGGKSVYAAAKCESNDDVLFVCDETEADTYYIFHLTYSAHNAEGFPKYEKFEDICALKEFLEKMFDEKYM